MYLLYTVNILSNVLSKIKTTLYNSVSYTAILIKKTYQLNQVKVTKNMCEQKFQVKKISFFIQIFFWDFKYPIFLGKPKYSINDLFIASVIFQP